MLENTTTVTTVSIDRKDKELTVIYPTPGNGNRTIFKIPEGSKWSPSPHWHERYTEYLTVLKGRVLFTIDGRSHIARPEDGPQEVKKYAIHNFYRADAVEDSIDPGEVIVEERTEPSDGMKEVYFRNIFSTVLQARSSLGRAMPIQLNMINANYDNFETFIPGQRLSWLVTHAIYKASNMLGWLLGLQSWYKEFTPERLHAIAASGGTGTKLE